MLIQIYCLIAILLIPISTKITHTEIRIKQFVKQKRFVYIGKMNFDIGESTIQFDIKMLGVYTRKISPQLRIGVISSERIDEFKKINKCQQKQNLFNQYRSIVFLNNSFQTVFAVNETIKQRSWYYYFYTCQQQIQQERYNDGLMYTLDVISLNKGNHLGQNQEILEIYIVAFIIVFCIFLSNIKKINKDVKDEYYDYAHIAITIAITCSVVGYLLKILYMLSYAKDGHKLEFFDSMFHITKYTSESIIIILLTMIAWGWTVTFIHGNQGIYVPLGIVGILLNIICSTTGMKSDDGIDKNHHFDCPTGKIIISFRCAIIALFLIGLIKTYGQVPQKVKSFFRKFGIFSLIYLTIYPATVLICEYYCDEHLQNQIITGVIEITHGVGIGILTYMLTSVNSSYAKLEFNNRNTFTKLSQIDQIKNS